MRSIVIAVCLCLAAASAFAAEVKPRFSVTNIVLSAEDPLDGNRYTSDYNRLRLDASVFFSDVELKLIVDDEAFIGGAYLDSPGYELLREYRPDVPFDPYVDAGESENVENRLRLYRAYARMRIENTTVTAGLFRVGLGVGKLWAPVDVFNPRDPLAIEPGEREGVAGGMVKHFIDGFTSIEAAGAFDRNDRPSKYLVRFKTFIDTTDLGLLVLRTEELRMAGWEVTGSAPSGIELRTEGGWFIDDVRDASYLRGIVGGEYGFPGGLTLAAEYLHNGSADEALPLGGGDPAGFSQTGSDYVGISATYLLTPLVTPGASIIQNLDDASRAVTASVTVSVTDETEASGGIQSFFGEADSEYGGLEPVLYLRLTHYF